MTHHPENIRRASSAARALDAYRLANGVDDDDAMLCDIIADLGHYSDQHDLEFLAIVARAIGAWAVERKAPDSDEAVPLVRIHIGEGGQRTVKPMKCS